MPVDERTFAAEIAGWVTDYLGDNPSLPFSRAAVEEHVVEFGHPAEGNGIRLSDYSSIKKLSLPLTRRGSWTSTPRPTLIRRRSAD